MQLLTDALHRIAYATDASAYREMPLAVAYPHNEDDLRWLLTEAQRRHTHLIPRAGGTSIAGQVVGNGIVVDVSRYMNAILEINPDQRWVRVQPGVVRDELNLALQPYGLFFSPETSTSNRCCIGGMVGNNSCGTHSLIYGSTRHHVIGMRIMLADGSVHGIGQLSVPDEQPSELYQSILQQLHTWQQDPQVMSLLRTNFPDPSLQRRSCGYALDETLNHQSSIINNQYTISNKLGLNLCSLITGSEGTLCFVTEIMLSLDPIPPAHKIAVCQFLNHIDEAWQANLEALQQHPVAVELIDGKILQLAKDNPAAAQHMQVLGLDPNHLPAAILVSEFWSDSTTISNLQPATCNHQSSTFVDSKVDAIWSLRKAGLGVLTGMDGDAKPVGVIEDTAVAPQRLADYIADFRAMLDSLQLDCVYYGHISTGELHLRPILNLKDPNDRIKFRQVAQATAELVKKHHGSLSGEHGDGRLRGEFIPLVYGQEVYDLFCQLKRTWDPNSLLNMGKIVNTPPMDAFLRYDQSPICNNQSTISNNQSAIINRVERCNGSADCRKSIAMGGLMCPTYKMSRDEILSTRARANILREKLTRDPHGITSEEVQEVLDSCLACKGCKSDCPSNVDMTTLRSELLQLQHDIQGTPFRSWMVARMAIIERLGSLVPAIYNFCATNTFISSIIKRIVRFSPHRRIPTIARHSMRKQINNQSTICNNQSSIINNQSKTIYLFADEFTSLHEPALGLHFAQLLTALGYRVIVPKHVESGRAAMSKGCLRLAAKYAKRNIRLLAPLITPDTPLIGIEPSCILSFRDEYPRLVDDPRAQTLAQNTFLYDEWLMREVQRGRISADNFTQLHQTIYLHGHCHQKAIVGIQPTADCLRLTGADVHIIPSSCCGMAGSFGYEKEHYDTSMAIGESVLFPAVRAAKGIVCAPGTSCRQQILDGTGIQAIHPIEVLYQLVKKH
ncbi:MAG: FAD-binding protein [Paludibacteraceae bacterium]|nr:FAD-binding protein [Paludibacteraceae bacterium]